MQALPRFSRAALAAAALCAATLSSPLALAAPPADQRADASSAPANSADTATWRALSRLGYGPTPALVAQVRQAGGARAWALAQVDAAFAASRLPPAPAPELAAFDQPLPQIFASVKAEREARRALRDARADTPPGNAMTPPMAGNINAKQAASPDMAPELSYIKDSAQGAAAWRLAACSQPTLENPLLARLTEFWFNHLNVSADKGAARAFVGHYVLHAIRPNVLGRFEDLLLASARHPAMLYYLDQALSVAEGTMQGERRRGLNENYARELMELHTLGVNGGYTQNDVRELARVLTGWTVAPQQPDGFRFAPRLHDDGAKTVLGRAFGPTDPRDARAGEAEGLTALHLLATQPATAHRVALRLAQWFVADQPPPALVDQLARTFQSSQGDLRAVMRQLVQSPAFWDPSNRLFKTPLDFTCSAMAATGAGTDDERELRRSAGFLNNAGQGLHRWPTPDGYKTDAATWRSPDALTRRADLALALGRGAPDLGWLQPFLSPATRARIAAQPAQLQAGLMLASPDFMNK
ncbi:DUF1800 domain-containing protein [Ottowia sp.]|uniref:DUF1800 domain-containing protein n=1 Tax=Ottowia sp. TaxID=1898956 RepID=UPI002B6B0A62|nr:DUF1800 domain-containing protein [Ottowia sp.]MCP5259372.1 DUF1800 domain-containing protein [Burkholderiaceae bacterium]HRW72374.1 DUF1800 domain-containing protein [Ottowia sp.]